MLYFISTISFTFISLFFFFFFFFFFFNDTATTEIYTLSLHDALPIYPIAITRSESGMGTPRISTALTKVKTVALTDRKSTRLNSSHSQISYAVFCLKKKKKKKKIKKQIKKKKKKQQTKNKNK